VYNKHGIPVFYQGYVPYEEILPGLSSYDYNRAASMIRAGPVVLCDLFGDNKVLRKKVRDFIIDPSYFEFQAGCTWLDTESTQISDANPSDIAKQILSNILADLQIDEERVLRLDAYAEIQYVKFEDCINLDDPACKKFFADLFNKKNFKHIKRDPKLYLENCTSIDFLYEQGIDLTKVDVYNDMISNYEDENAFPIVVAHYKKRNLPLKSDKSTSRKKAPTRRKRISIKDHWRSQPYGERKSKRKRVWIKKYVR
jgi:hypothetical protein